MTITWMKRRIVIGIIACVLIVALLIIGLRVLEPLKNKGTSDPIPVADTAKLWYKQAIIYNLDVEVFKDADGDGTGDFKGLIQKLDYLDSLGVTVIWLAPFQPTPNLDDGYDVADFYGVDKRLGTLADFKAFIRAADRHHIRVIMDLVANHTSNQHPWFLKARSNRLSPYRSWYVWSPDRPDNYDRGMVFPGVQKDIWTYDSTAGEYYYHRFYDFQPDLNLQNTDVQQELKRVIKYWLDLGIAGFRVDAVPFLIEVPQKKGEHFNRQYALLAGLRRYVTTLKPDAIILGEANVAPDENKDYFGERGERMNMMFNFFVNQHLFYALATADIDPLKKALTQTSGLPEAAQWGQFLRNHDEVDLGRLSNRDRKKVYEAFGPDSSMQLYGRGIRRRLAPMLHDRRRLEMAYSLLLALPSTPVLRYGDEIGMGDDLSLQERMSVRTPMQWSAGHNAGFSTADTPVRPVIASGPYDYHAVNVTAQLSNNHSLLRWMKRMIRLRQSCPELSYGAWKIVDAGSQHVLAIQYNWQGKQLLTVHNFSSEKTAVIFPEKNARLVDLCTGAYLSEKEHHAPVVLEGYGYGWFRINPKN